MVYAWRRTATLAATALTAAALAAGCGGSESSSSTGDAAAGGDRGVSPDALAQAKATVEKAKAMPPFSLDAPAFDASKARGKTIFSIPISSSNEFNVTVDKEMAKIAEQLGVNFVEFENPGTTTSYNQGFARAIANKVDVVIMMGGGDPSLVLPSIAQAKAAGIPTISSHFYQFGDAPSSVTEALGAMVFVDFNGAARLMTDYAVANTPEKLHPLIIGAKELVPSNGMVSAIKDELGKLCPTCEAKVIDVPATQWPTKMQSAVQSALAADPKLNYILPVFDPMVLTAQAGVTAAGRAGQVKIASYATTPAVLKLIQEGDTVAMDVGEDVRWVAYATMDQALRVLSGVAPLPDGPNNEKLGLRIFDKSNVDETGRPPVAGKGFGDDYVDGYRKLWGVTK